MDGATDAARMSNTFLFFAKLRIWEMVFASITRPSVLALITSMLFAVMIVRKLPPRRDADGAIALNTPYTCH